jgi:hypothetical protein
MNMIPLDAHITINALLNIPYCNMMGLFTMLTIISWTLYILFTLQCEKVNEFAMVSIPIIVTTVCMLVVDVMHNMDNDKLLEAHNKGYQIVYKISEHTSSNDNGSVGYVIPIMVGITTNTCFVHVRYVTMEHMIQDKVFNIISVQALK